MLPLKIAIMWHFHQPYYKKEDEFILPWVRLHGIKDYLDINQLFFEYQNIKQTINIVPSLQMQIEEYISNNTKDKIQRLSQLNPSSLSIEEKREILRLFFLCNLDNMIMPNSRYKELWTLAQNENAINIFKEQDWLDLQVWYNLAWVGNYSKERNAIKRLFAKGKNFSIIERNFLLDYHIEILKEIKPTIKYLQELGQIEISVSPFYHPILPLLVSSRIALEALPNIELPEIEFTFPQDADKQIELAKDYYLKTMNIVPNGMWPSEGSISNEVLALIAKNGIKWVATDEDVLAQSLKENYKNYYKYFPILYHNQNTKIAILFRDHALSDSIGFIYSKWDAHDAVANFLYQLKNIKDDLVNTLGEESLKYAVVPIILDGENCWEFYKDNGIHFQHALFSNLSNSDDFITVTCNEAVKEENLGFIEPINNIRAGSWINADFRIWAGHQEHRCAWSMLAKARKAIEDSIGKINDEKLQSALNEAYIAEGSDWFWWYGDEHIAENKNDFDVLFRWHLTQIYKYLGIDPPEELSKPISEIKEHKSLVMPKDSINPIIDGILSNPNEWDNAGYYEASSLMTTMHQIGEILQKIWFGSNNEKIFFKCDLLHYLEENEQIEFQFKVPYSFSLIIEKDKITFASSSEFQLSFLEFAKKDFIEFALFKKQFIKDNLSKSVNIGFSVRTISNNLEIFYPRQGHINITV